MTPDTIAAFAVFVALTTAGWLTVAAAFWLSSGDRARRFTYRLSHAIERAAASPHPWRWQ